MPTIKQGTFAGRKYKEEKKKKEAELKKKETAFQKAKREAVKPRKRGKKIDAPPPKQGMKGSGILSIPRHPVGASKLKYPDTPYEEFYTDPPKSGLSKAVPHWTKKHPQGSAGAIISAVRTMPKKGSTNDYLREIREQIEDKHDEALAPNVDDDEMQGWDVGDVADVLHQAPPEERLTEEGKGEEVEYEYGTEHIAQHQDALDAIEMGGWDEMDDMEFMEPAGGANMDDLADIGAGEGVYGIADLTDPIDEDVLERETQELSEKRLKAKADYEARTYRQPDVIDPYDDTDEEVEAFAEELDAIGVRLEGVSDLPDLGIWEGEHWRKGIHHVPRPPGGKKILPVKGRIIPPSREGKVWSDEAQATYDKVYQTHWGQLENERQRQADYKTAEEAMEHKWERKKPTKKQEKAGELGSFKLKDGNRVLTKEWKQRIGEKKWDIRKGMPAKDIEKGSRSREKPTQPGIAHAGSVRRKVAYETTGVDVAGEGELLRARWKGRKFVGMKEIERTGQKSKWVKQYEDAPAPLVEKPLEDMPIIEDTREEYREDVPATYGVAHKGMSRDRPEDFDPYAGYRREKAIHSKEKTKERESEKQSIRYRARALAKDPTYQPSWKKGGAYGFQYGAHEAEWGAEDREEYKEPKKKKKGITDEPILYEKDLKFQRKSGQEMKYPTLSTRGGHSYDTGITDTEGYEFMVNMDLTNLGMVPQVAPADYVPMSYAGGELPVGEFLDRAFLLDEEIRRKTQKKREGTDKWRAKQVPKQPAPSAKEVETSREAQINTGQWVWDKDKKRMIDTQGPVHQTQLALAEMFKNMRKS